MDAIARSVTVYVFLLIIRTLFLVDMSATWLKNRWGRFDRIMDGLPVLLVERGDVLQENLDAHRVNINDIQEAMRGQGLRRLDEVDYAVLERSGGIAIIAKNE